jgi:hypothetical protein
MIRSLRLLTLLLVTLAVAVWASSTSTEITGSWTIDRKSTIAEMQNVSDQQAHMLIKNDPFAVMLYQSTIGAAIDQTAHDIVSNWTMLLTLRDNGTFVLRESTLLFAHIEIQGTWEYDGEDRNTVILSVEGEKGLAIRRDHRGSRLYTIHRNRIDEDGALAVVRKPRRIEIPYLAARLWWNSR